ncbi:g2510 [Coccomyxa elongata]
MSIFLDVDIGDAAQNAKEVDAYTLTSAFFDQIGPQLGLSGPLKDCDTESKEILREAFAADPAWSSKGEFRAESPSDIRAGRLIIELFTKEVPKTCENFRCLVDGSKGLGKASKKPLHYKGCKFHRIVKGFCCQGGDVVRGDGSGSDSIYGAKFNDEKPGLRLRHEASVVSMANSGKNTNSCQFFLTLAPAPQCDGKHVVFGRVVQGHEVLRRIDEEAASSTGVPRVDVTIADCGLL